MAACRGWIGGYDSGGSHGRAGTVDTEVGMLCANCGGECGKVAVLIELVAEDRMRAYADDAVAEYARVCAACADALSPQQGSEVGRANVADADLSRG